MNITRLCALALTAGAAVAVAGCADEGYGGYGYARPYAGGYYGGPYGDPYAYDVYYDGYYGYGYGSPWFGWYDDFYYPGVGFYVYDRGGGRYRWNDRQRQYWTGRRGNGYTGTPNWSQYRNRGTTPNGAAAGAAANGTTTYSGRTWNGGAAASGSTGTYSGRSWGGRSGGGRHR